MKRRKNWFGESPSKETSLLDCGFLMRYTGNGIYQVLFRNGHEGESPLFSYGWFDPEEWRGYLQGSIGTDNFPETEKIADLYNMDSKEWMRQAVQDPLFMLSGLLSYYRADDVICETEHNGHIWFTESQIRQRLNKALH